MTQVFISYSRKDLVFVERLAKDLIAADLEVWYDLKGLEVGNRWTKEIQSAIRQSQYFIIVLSPNSVESEWVENEFLLARNLNLKIIPLQVRSCDLPIWILNRNYIDIQGENYQRHFGELLQALGAELSLEKKTTERKEGVARQAVKANWLSHERPTDLANKEQWGKKKTEKTPGNEHEVPQEQKQIEGKPLLGARSSKEGKLGESVLQIPDPDKTRVAVPEISHGIVLRNRFMKIHPSWIIAFVGLVVVIIIAIWGVHSLYIMPAHAGYVYFTSDHSGKAEIYYMDPKGKIVRVTDNEYARWSPMPAGNGYVYFTSDQSGKAEIYYMDPKGKIVQVTNNEFDCWKSDGRTPSITQL